MAQMWFGTREHAEWVPCPRVNMQAGKVSWGSISKYLGGGNYVRRSTAAAKEYTLEWALNSRDALRPILDYADGFYGTGDLYFSDPFTMDKNVLPAHWAQGYINAIDGPLAADTFSQWPPTTTGIMTGVSRPPLVDLGESVNGFPTSSGGAFGEHTLFIPVPPGYRFWFSMHDTVANAGGFLEITLLTDGVATAGPYFPAVSALTDDVLSSFAMTATAPNQGFQLRTLGDTYYTGMMAQVLPNAITPNFDQGFKSGQGHSGLQFAPPGVEYYEYSSALDKVQASAILVEVGSWR